MNQNQPILTIRMTLDGVNAVLGVLGKTPTESDLHPLYADIKAQANAQLRQIEADKAKGAAEDMKPE